MFEAKRNHPGSMNARSDRAYIDYGAFGRDDEWCECLRDADHAPDIYSYMLFAVSISKSKVGIMIV